MEMDAPEFLCKLCATESIRPFSHYVQRSPWRLREANVVEAFLGKMGLYCCWWSGPRKLLLDRIAQYKYKDELYPVRAELPLGHNLIPTYVGMTATVTRRKGNRLVGRMVDRLVRFPTAMTLWLSSSKEAPLIRQRFGMSDNFVLFDYPERIRARLAAMSGVPNMSLAEAQTYLDTHQSECRELIAEFHEDYCSLMFDNYSISFVPFTYEPELFYAEALAIGLLRPCLNHS